MRLPGKGRVAWVTGSGKGIGRAVALALAAEGWRVAVSARTAADLDVLVREAPAGAITPFVLDVTDPLATAAVIARVNAEMGPIALAILNAGTHRPTPLAGFSASDLAALIDVNLMGVAHGLAALLAAPTPARDIAVVASLAGYRGLPRAACLWRQQGGGDQSDRGAETRGRPGRYSVAPHQPRLRGDAADRFE